MDTDKYELVLGVERDINKPIIALTNCQIMFSDRYDLNRCIDEIRASDIRLSARPEAEVLYDWQHAAVRGLTLHFGVRWYDRQYFEEHRDVYLNMQHSRLFSQFGVNADDFKVTHYVAA